MFDLRLGDCLEVMRSMPDCSVDSIVTDPPYGMSFQSQWVPAERRKAKIAGDGKPFIWWLAEAHHLNTSSWPRPTSSKHTRRKSPKPPIPAPCLPPCS